MNKGDKKTYTQKIIGYWRKKLEKIQINGSIYRVHGSKELISLKRLYYPEKSTDSTQFLLNTNGIIPQNWKKYTKNLYGTTANSRKKKVGDITIYDMLSEISQVVRDKYHMISPLTGT